jgi:hypothetical protein
MLKRQRAKIRFCHMGRNLYFIARSIAPAVFIVYVEFILFRQNFASLLPILHNFVQSETMLIYNLRIIRDDSQWLLLIAYNSNLLIAYY